MCSLKWDSPAGAMSSWGMFALTHHVCVQASAQCAGFGGGWYQDYALLGDDIVICHQEVAYYYTLLMKSCRGWYKPIEIHYIG